MKPAPTLANETSRLAALRHLRVLDTPPEERFDRFTRLLKQFFGVRIALVCLVDRDRQWFKSVEGLTVCETARSISFCGHAVADEHLFVIEDALLDDRFVDNPLVTGPPHIRFYAGCPLRAEDGHIVGTLCVIDDQPRTFSHAERDSLRDLGLIVEAELRRSPSSAANGENAEPKNKLRGSGRRWWKRALLVFSRRRWAALSGLIVALLLSAAAVSWDHQQLASHRAQVRHLALHTLGLLRGELESALNSKLHLVYGLGGFVRSTGEIDEAGFQAFAPLLARDIRNVRSLQLAPGGVVQHVWPTQDNLAAIGHDLLRDPLRQAAAKQAIEERKLWVSGPVDLRQGGQALIGRLPIFVGKEKEGAGQFWGFSTIVVDLPGLMAEVGMSPNDEEFQYAVRGLDATGELGEPFYGTAEIFSLKPMAATVKLPAGSWELAIYPIGGWPQAWPGQPTFRSAAIFMILLVSGLIYFLLRIPNNLRRAIDAATHALETSRRHFQDAIEALPAGFVIYDRNDKLRISNDQFCEIYKRSRPRVQAGRSYEEIFRYGMQAGEFHDAPVHDEGRQEAFAEIILQRHQMPSAAYDQRLASGQWIRVVERRMRDGGSVSFHVDVTDQKQAEQDLDDARRRAEQANQAKSTFLATVSHEVRTPLNGVLGLLGVLREDSSLGEKQASYVKTAHQSGELLLSLLNEILDISKMEAGKLELEPGDFCVADTVREAAQLVENQATAKGLQLEYRLEQEVECMVNGDEGRLRQVLLNLLTNAVKFTDSGSVTITASARGSENEPLEVEILVKDTGIGFSQSDAERLFAPFSQLDSDARRRFKGTGLGLAICRRLIDLMKGSISVESRPGEGASFRVQLKLPRGQVQAAAMPSTPERPPVPAELGWSPVRLLLAEDSPTNQIVLRAMLEGTGYSLDVVGTGREAVDSLKRQTYDLVLMDVFMPELDGLGATREIRALSDIARMPIIALTANAMAGDRERFVAAGMDDYLPKPINRAALLSLLHGWVQKVRAGQAKENS